MTMLMSLSPPNPLGQLRKLKPRTRNQVRAILASQTKDALRLLNKIREEKTAREIVQIERSIRDYSMFSTIELPEIFPAKIQTKENYYRLEPLSPAKQLEQIECLALEHKKKINSFVVKSAKLGRHIVRGELECADVVVKEIADEYGLSNFLFRKALLMRSLASSQQKLKQAESILESAGIGSNNLIASSILRCYEEGQSKLSLKRSVMSLTDKGKANRFTRDITRLAFHPHAKDLSDLGGMIQSNLQSSLIDAILIVKINKHWIKDPEQYSALESIFSLWDSSSITVDEIAAKYIDVDDGESLFYKHSSAWYENSEIIKYRTLQDHFYDDPGSSYFEINDDLIAKVNLWVRDLKLEEISSSQELTIHSHKILQRLESAGMVTRSAIFNYLAHRANGQACISEASLYDLMGRTHDLAKTVNIEHIRNLVRYCDSDWSLLIYYLLIAKRSGNEVDDHRLRKLVEKMAQDRYESSLIAFVEAVELKSLDVACFAYEVFTADFISKLTRIIKTSAQITETRAALHRWRGKATGEQAFIDRARTLIIDHKINLVRNELDDNRIYVDAVRFDEWINDELIRDLSTLFTSLAHNHDFLNGEEALILQVIEKAYYNFCSNNKFGIASYLGRRIRHGTFKGHLFSSVIGIEKLPKYSRLFNDVQFSGRWHQWKSLYESKIDAIIRDRLHIESPAKRDGLLKPTISTAGKHEIAVACAKSMVKHFAENKTMLGIPLILTEYCWRIAEIDLRNASNYLKGQRVTLLMQDFLSELNGHQANRDIAKEFNRELVHSINEKLKVMHGWFKKPVSVAPKASLSLLYRAVIAEVKETFSNFEAETDYEESEDIEIMGGAYHVLYDALYVIIFNAAKHGKQNGKIERSFSIKIHPGKLTGSIMVVISSEIPDHECEQQVNDRLKVTPEDDIDNAQLTENRSGIRKLHHLQRVDKNFLVHKVNCENRRVCAVMSYNLEHL